jgi:hypothetical protein
MKRFVFLSSLLLLSLCSLHAQFVFNQITTGLNDVYESGNSLFGLGDIDNDGDIDIISVGDHYGGLGVNEDGIMVFKNNGNGTAWEKTMSGGFGYGGVALGDVNNDGKMDVAYGIHHNYSSTDFGDQRLEVVLGDGTGLNWTPWDDGLGLQGQSWGMFGCDLADIDNDGLLDLGANSFGCCDGAWIYKNNGNGTWTTMGGTLISTDNSNFQFRFGDFNGDGRTDFIVNNTQFNNQPYQVWKNDGNGIFSPITAGLPFSGAWGDFQFKMDIADVNHDGAADIAVTCGSYAWVYTYNTATNTWVNFSTGLPTTAQAGLLVALGDIDHDGHLDLATYRPGQITIYKGDGAGNWFQAATLPIPETTGYDFKLADLDHNGFLDIVYWAKYNGSNMLRVYLQTTPATELSLLPVYPNGGEFFLHGSAQLIHWTSTVPSPATATVDIDFSSTGPLGPFTNIVTNAPNSGTYQWHIPLVSSGNCYLKFTIDNGMSTYVAATAEPFCIDTCGTSPAIPGPISGPATICAGDSCIYSIPVTPGATSYTWVLPAGWVGSSTTTSINAIAGQTSGNVSVIANFAGGNSSSQPMYVTVVLIDTNVIQAGITLTAVASGANYQWIDCITGNTISGATGQSFIPTINGVYAVIVTKNSCLDTSGCYNVIVTNTAEISAGTSLIITPNPTTGYLAITCCIGILKIEIYSMLGEVIYRSDMNHAFQELDISNNPAGIYFLKIITKGGTIFREIVKQE